MQATLPIAAVFKVSHLRALGSLLPILVVFAVYQALSWFMFRRFSSFGLFAFLLPGFVYFQTRNTFVEVSEHGLRVRSHRSSSRDPMVLAWSDANAQSKDGHR